MAFRSFLIIAMLLAVGVLCAGLALADDDDAAADAAPAASADGGPLANRGSAWEMTAAQQRAIENGLAWLAKAQNDDGSFGSSGAYSRHVGISGLAGIAFLSDGSVPGRGRYGEHVAKVSDFIIDSTSDSSGLIASDQVSHGPMYGHGFATLFLAEIYGMTGRADCREKLRLAVRLIVNTQNDEGGWRYMPVPNDADLSVSICQVMALRAARNTGIKVPKKTIDKAIEYVKKSQNGDGGFSYTLQGRGSAFPRSAAGVAALQYSGIYTGKEISNGLAYLLKQKPKGGQIGGHFFYGQYYAVQAFFLAGGDYWKQWFPAIRQALLKSQSGDGSWSGGAGNEYATAMALIILQVPNRYLPILER